LGDEGGLKVAHQVYQYWSNQGQPRTTFLAFEGAYHGDTVGAMSVGARSLFSKVFGELLFDVEFVLFPATYSLAVTVCTEEIYDAFYSDDPTKTLYHGHSYTANPLGCAAAIASWELLAQNEAAFKTMEAKHLRHLNELRQYSQVEHVRVMGTIAALDLVTP